MCSIYHQTQEQKKKVQDLPLAHHRFEHKLAQTRNPGERRKRNPIVVLLRVKVGTRQKKLLRKKLTTAKCTHSLWAHSVPPHLLVSLTLTIDSLVSKLSGFKNKDLVTHWSVLANWELLNGKGRVGTLVCFGSMFFLLIDTPLSIPPSWILVPRKL